MLRKLSAFILLSISASAAAYAQQTPESKKPAERSPERFFYIRLTTEATLGVQRRK